MYCILLFNSLKLNLISWKEFEVHYIFCNVVVIFIEIKVFRSYIRITLFLNFLLYSSFVSIVRHWEYYFNQLIFVLNCSSITVRGNLKLRRNLYGFTTNYLESHFPTYNLVYCSLAAPWIKPHSANQFYVSWTCLVTDVWIPGYSTVLQA